MPELPRVRPARGVDRLPRRHQDQGVTHFGPSPTGRAQAAPKPQWPTTFEGAALATHVRDSAGCSADTKARLIREIIEHEASHGTCTRTFIGKVRKQIRPPA